MSKVCYISPDAPFFTMRVEVEGKDRRVKFANKELRLDEEKDAALIAVLDELIETRPNVSSIIHKVDVEAAKELALAHQKQLRSQRGTLTGPISADDAKRSAQMAVQERDADLASQGATAEDLGAMRSEMSKDGLELTENAEGVIAPDTREGFVADPKPEASSDPTTAPADPKKLFASLSR